MGKREKAMKESTLAISLLCLGCFLSIDKVQGYRYEPSGSCPASYVYVAGDIPGNGLGAFWSANIANCAKRCDAKSNCGSFEYSPRRKHCNLNSESKPTTGVYQDFDFCVKKEDSMAKEVEALKNNMAKEVEALKNNMAKEVKALKNNTVKKTELQENMDRLSENSARLDKLSQRGAYCGLRKWGWYTANSVIKYDKLMLSEGKAGFLVSRTGVWTTRVPGLYQINWSLINHLYKKPFENKIYLYRNGKEIVESVHDSYSERIISEMGGRTMLLRLAARDTLTLRTGKKFKGDARRIHFCVMLLAAE